MALPIFPILLVAAIGTGAVLLGRAKKITGGGGVGPVTPGAYGGYRVLSRAEVVAIGGGKTTYFTPTGATVPATDPAVDAMIISLARVGGIAMLALKSPATGEIVLTGASIDAIIPDPAYQGRVIEARTIDLKTKKTTPVTGPLVGSKIGFSPKDVIDVYPPKNLTMNAPQGEYGTA